MKLIFDPRAWLQREGLGNINYQTNPLGSGGIAFTGANNGLSISTITPGTVVLGQNVGQAGNPAALLSSREIPLNTFSLLFNGIGNPGVVVFKEDPARLIATPYLLFQNSAGGEDGRVNFRNNDLYIGGLCGANITAPSRNTCVGHLAMGAATTSNFNSAFGNGALSSVTTSATGAHCAFGDGTLSNNTAGAGNSGFGFQALINIQTGGNNTGIGIQAGGAIYLASADNVCIGAASAYNVGRVGVTASQNVYIGSQCAAGIGTVGSGNIAIGYNFNNGATNMGTNNIFIGLAQVNTVACSNSTMIGAGMDMQVSNTVIVGRTDQNVGIGQTTTAALLTSKLKVFGTLATGGAAPLTLGAGVMDFGKVVTAASVLNATKYLEMVVDGVLVKVCIN